MNLRFLKRLFDSRNSRRFGGERPVWNAACLRVLVTGAVSIVMMANVEAAQDSREIGVAASPVAESGQKESTEDSDSSSTLALDGELGRQTILRRRDRPRLFRIFSDTQYLYDSNVLLADGDFLLRGEDAVFIESVGASFSPSLIEPLTSSFFY